MKNSLMYKMSYFRFPELFGGQRTLDRVRNQDIPESPTLDVLDEAFTSENWIVRLLFFLLPLVVLFLTRADLYISLFALSSLGPNLRRQTSRSSRSKPQGRQQVRVGNETQEGFDGGSQAQEKGHQLKGKVETALGISMDQFSLKFFFSR